MPTDAWLNDTRTSYDTVATSHADVVRDALAGGTYLRGALSMFAERVDGGLVVDVGCGTGHVTAHPRGLGTDARRRATAATP